MSNYTRQNLAVVGILTLSIFTSLYAIIRVSPPKPAARTDSWKILPNGVAVWDIGPLPAVTMDVQNTVNYQLNATPSTNAQWTALYPHGGVVHLGPDAKPFLPSVFHQLRCLDIIRLAYAAQEENVVVYHEGVSKNRRDGHGYHSGAEQSDFTGVVEDARARHCLNYLRQMLLCRSDLNLESVQAMGPGDPNIHAVSPRRTQTCQDWTVVYDKLHALAHQPQ
ncbi:hypothetical protein K435DRAFT_137359 [Dendrothele bispora CBS 962.96]|uniref:Uncharacterized protein n=1 Tax=Dendrothele bispora (strain CBS 962.96) TaxID=1314807 RepID=A0A4V4HI41_DENBC|nr:hypothetical protein K435DRAFT_137359 [Dendrothele bispora CBS 962.96]